MNLDISQLDPRQVRTHPWLPSPALALLFLAGAVLDLTLALVGLAQFGPRQVSPQLIFAVERDIAVGILLGVLIVSGYDLIKTRSFEAVIRAAVTYAPTRVWVINLLGTLAVVLAYALTFWPVVFPGAEGPAGRSLMAVPLDLALAFIMWDLRSCHREAWRIIKEVHGLDPPWLTWRQPAVAPEVASLRPADLRERPRWQYNLPALLLGLQSVLVAVGTVSVVWGWSAGFPLWLGIPGEVWLYGLGGIGIGLWGCWHESRALRGHEETVAIYAILREQRRFPFYVWDWWGYTVIVPLVFVALAGLLRMAELQVRLAGGALSLGYGLGVTPLYRYYLRPWRRAWALLRELKGGRGGLPL